MISGINFLAFVEELLEANKALLDEVKKPEKKIKTCRIDSSLFYSISHS